MASIRKHGNKWQARVRRKGHPEIVKSFFNKSDSERWARIAESEMDRGVFVSRHEAESTSLAQALSRYREEISVHKKGAIRESYRIRLWERSNISQLALATIKGADIAKWRDIRIGGGASSNTVRLDLALLSHLFDVAQKEWGISSLQNPVQLVRRPKTSQGRERRISEEEIAVIIKASCSRELPAIIRLAVETGMRRGEILELNWENIDLSNATAYLPDTKNGESRTVPLSTKAVGTLRALSRNIHGSVFTSAGSSVSHAFNIAVRRARIEYEAQCREAGKAPFKVYLYDLHFHDLRHEATSRLFERGFNPMEVATITGHKTLQMLKRYTHLKAEDLARKLG